MVAINVNQQSLAGWPGSSHVSLGDEPLGRKRFLTQRRKGAKPPTSYGCTVMFTAVETVPSPFSFVARAVNV